MSIPKSNPTKLAQRTRLNPPQTNTLGNNSSTELEAEAVQDYSGSTENTVTRMVAPGGQLRTDWAKSTNILSLQRVIGNRAVMRKLLDQKSGAVVQRMTGASVLTGKATAKALTRGPQLQLDLLIGKIRDKGTDSDQQVRALKLYDELKEKHEQEKMQELITLLQAISDDDFETEGTSGGLDETTAAEYAEQHEWWEVTSFTMASSQTYKAGKKHTPKGRLYTDGTYFYSGDNTGHAGTDWKIYGGGAKSLDWRGGVSNDATGTLIQRGAQRGRGLDGKKL